jgi:hypothetical protein
MQDIEGRLYGIHAPDCAITVQYFLEYLHIGHKAFPAPDQLFQEIM